MSFSSEFIYEIQAKKRKQQQHLKSVKIDLQQIQHRTQLPSIKNEQQRIKITQDQFMYLLKLAKNKIIKQPSLLKLQCPIYVATGTLGSYRQLSIIFQKCGNPKFVNYLFLGDYTGKYKNGIQCLVTLLIYKIKFPQNFFLLRGCYDQIDILKSSLFYEEVIQYFGSQNVWIQICQLFCCLPFAATINFKIFCVHGGIDSTIFSIQQISLIRRPYGANKNGLPYHLIHSYPTLQESINQQNDQIYDEETVQSFLKRTNFKMICRGHSVAQHGFQYMFNKKVVNICSISNYCSLYSNKSAVMMVDDQCNVIFKQLSNGIFSQPQVNQENLTFQQIVQRRQQKKQQLGQQQDEKSEEKSKESERKFKISQYKSKITQNEHQKLKLNRNEPIQQSKPQKKFY